MIALMFYGRTWAEDLFINGTYQGKNLYIQNSNVSGTGKYCTIRAFVNDTEVVNIPMTSAYEIDLSSVEIGQKVTVRIEHHAGCIPVVFNPQVIREKKPFKFVRIELKDSSLGWTSSSDKIGDYYYIEKRIEEKWIMIKSLKAKGGIGNNDYSVGIMNSIGDNKYRIKCIQKEDNIIYSPLVTYYSKDDPVTFYPTRVDDKIYLSRIANFEILDMNGNLLTNGTQKEIDVNDLSAGLYYLIIEAEIKKFYKK